MHQSLMGFQLGESKTFPVVFDCLFRDLVSFNGLLRLRALIALVALYFSHILLHLLVMFDDNLFNQFFLHFHFRNQATSPDQWQLPLSNQLLGIKQIFFDLEASQPVLLAPDLDQLADVGYLHILRL